ncbi:MAG: hypothetical protein TR69_WS6001000006 [candidate division WS6 bacterium OLB20]|uniref:Uncharacterized protein n=1 Tax=candidate division WS6 bacterium OLB20 TaxID=1617426 RepID=A0A136M0X8_9BACT|nr:MAG: hypothetical protein TR69_WS6001000006 [candidate division WS6 bacterium OLB20]
MPLTIDDLKKIESLFRAQEDRLREVFVTKHEFNELKDIVLGIKHDLHNEHELRFGRLVSLEARVQILEGKV